MNVIVRVCVLEITEEVKEMNAERKRGLISLFLILVGFLLAVGYPYLLYFTSEKTAIRVIKATLALIFIIVGSFLSATGFVLFKGVSTKEVE